MMSEYMFIARQVSRHLQTLFQFMLLLIVAACSQVEHEEDENQKLASEIEKEIVEMMKAYEVKGVAISVVRDQDVILSKGFGLSSEENNIAITETTEVGLFSATKTLTALTVLSLIEDGLIDINPTLENFRTDIPQEWKSIPFWRLLNHTSGITMIVNKPEFEALAGNPATSDEDILTALRAYSLDYLPGEYSRYRQSGYAIASAILSEKLGKSWPEIVDLHLIQPAKMTRTTHSDIASGRDTLPILSSAGGYITNADDISQLFLALNAGKIVSANTIKSEMLRPEYMFGDYSLGRIIEYYGESYTVGHRGGGARATVRYAPDQKIGVAVFTDQQNNHEMIIELSGKILRKALQNHPFDKSKQPIAIPLGNLKSQPVQSILTFYQEAKTKNKGQYNFSKSESALNSIGYYLLRQKRVDDAIKVFTLNTTEHPLSGNTYDSLGEAYLEKGDTQTAILNYTKALDLDPNNQNAVEVLKQISE